MLPEEIEKIKKQIQQSNILSAMEKAEWTQLLADMNDKQIQELSSILTPRARYVPPKVDIHQPEIGTSIAAHELEIPAHIGQPAPVAAASAKPQIDPHVSLVSNDPVLLQQRIEMAAKEMQQKKAVAERPVPAPAAPLAAPEPMPAPVQKAEPIKPEELSISFKQPADFSKISPEDIRGRNPAGSMETIIRAVVDVAKKNSIFEIIENVDKSPLYQTYIDMGFALLNDPNPDRDMAYANAADQRKRSGQPWLSKEEFEAFADFRKRLDQAM